MAIFLSTYAVQNWAITPVATAVGRPAPAVHDQLFQLVLSGVVFANMEGASNGNWGYNTATFQPDTFTPLNWAMGTYAIPKPTNTNYNLAFQVQQYAPLVTINAIFDAATAINAGWAADAFRPTPFGTGTDVTTHASLGSLFSGMDVDLAVRDTDAWLYRLGYTVTLIGKIVFPTAPIIS
jgi:hypothetical protein